MCLFDIAPSVIGGVKLELRLKNNCLRSWEIFMPEAYELKWARRPRGTSCLRPLLGLLPFQLFSDAIAQNAFDKRPSNTPFLPSRTRPCVPMPPSVLEQQICSEGKNALLIPKWWGWTKTLFSPTNIWTKWLLSITLMMLQVSARNYLSPNSNFSLFTEIIKFRKSLITPIWKQNSSNQSKNLRSRMRKC